jgi:hypothetical protein
MREQGEIPHRQPPPALLAPDQTDVVSSYFVLMFRPVSARILTVVSRSPERVLALLAAKIGEGRIPFTQAGLASADETADVGIDLGTPVVEAIGAEAKSRFTGRIPRVTVDVR